MKKRNKFLLLLAPLGAGLLLYSSLVPLSPDAERRPVPYLTSGSQATDTAAEQGHVLEVARIVEEDIEFEPGKAAFLETVVLQGTIGNKKAAISELRKIATPDAVAVLSLSLGDQDNRVRKAALEALSDIGTDEALAAIASATRSAIAADRARAAEALANTDGYSAANYLELLLHDDDPRVRAAAVNALGDIGDSRSVNIISRALRDPDPEVRERAAEVLDHLNDEALFHALYPRQ